MSSVVTQRARAMGSMLEIVVVADDNAVATEAAERAARRVDQLEQRWSRFLPDSDISRINRADGTAVVVDPATITLVTAMVEAWWATSGLYDPTLVASLCELGYVHSWDDPSLISWISPRSLGRGAPELIGVDPASSVVLPPAGTTLDAGGLGKGLAADLAVAEAVAHGATGALVSIGGDLRVTGRAPTAGGWRIDVADPARRLSQPASPAAIVCLADGGVATSGTSVRRWTAPTGGEVHHLLEPASGAPGRGDGLDEPLVSVTIVAGTGAWADAWSKAAFLDWTGVSQQLDALGIGAAAVGVSGRVVHNDTWALFAVRSPTFVPA